MYLSLSPRIFRTTEEKKKVERNENVKKVLVKFFNVASEIKTVCKRCKSVESLNDN